MTSLASDLRYALRSLRKNPGFALAAIVTLALGIGANGTMFSIVRGFLWTPLPVRAPGELAVVFTGQDDDWSFADLRDIRALPGIFADAIAYYPVQLALSSDGQNEKVYGEMVSANYFSMLGVTLPAGRGFRAGEAGGESPDPEVVLSWEEWRSRFHEDPGAIGRTLEVNGQPLTVVGVAPQGFHGTYYVGFQPAVWVPAGLFAQLTGTPAGRLDERGAVTGRVMGRLRPGVTVAQAQAAMTTLAERLGTDYPTVYAGVGAHVYAERDARPEPMEAAGFRTAGALFLAVVAIVLLIACANVANLLLARATGRRREIAVRLAVGASRWRLVRQLLAESALLAFLGGLAGIGVALWAGDAVASLLRLPTDVPFVFHFGVDPHVLGYMACMAAASGLVFGLVPALQAVNPSLAGELRGDASSARGPHRSRLRSALVIGQVAASCVLLVTAGLAVRTLGALRRVDPGFQIDRALLVGVTPDLQRYDRARGQVFYRTLLQRVRALPGVQAAALVQYVPMDFSSNGGPVFPEGYENVGRAHDVESSYWSLVSPGFFEAIDIPLVSGRDFTAQDDSAAPGVVIVNEAFAHRYWPGRPALGQRVRVRSADATPLTVIGVARDAKERSLAETPQPKVYLPLSQDYDGQATLLVRSAGAPAAVLPAVRGVITGLEPRMPVKDVRTMHELLAGRALLLPRFAASLAGGFGILALVLAVVGLYGVVSYTVGQRVKEIGIRVALGADRRRVARMVVGGGLRQASLGVAIGLALALAATRLLHGLLFGVGTADALTFGAVAVGLTGVALAASWIPARRAARVDPMVALRSE